MYKQFFSFLLTGCILLCVSCKKNESKPEPGGEQKSILLHKTSGVPGELIQLTTSFPLEKDITEIKFGSSIIVLAKVNDSLAAVRVPVLPPGTTTVDLSAVGIKDPVSFTINPYTPVQNPAIVKNAVLDSVSRIINSLSAGEFTSEAHTLQVMMAAFETEYAKLSEADKKSLAQVILQVQKEMSDLKKETGKIINLRNPLIVNTMTDEAYRSRINSVKLNIVVMLVSGAATASLFKAPEFSYSKGLSIITGGITVAYFYDTMVKLYEIYDATNFNISMESLIDLAIADVAEFPLRTGAGNFKDPEDKLILVNEKARSFKVKSGFRGVSAADAGSTISLFKELADAVATLKVGYDKLRAAVNSVTSWFSSDPAMPAFPAALPANPVSNKRATKGSYLSVANVSDPAIKLTASTGDSSITFKAESTTIKEDKDFSFDLVYNNTVLGITHKKWVTATFSLGLPIVGKWKIEKYKYVASYPGSGVTYDSAIANADEMMEFKADGTFSGKFEDNVGQGSWRIKDGDKLELYNINNPDFDLGEFGLQITTLNETVLILYSKDSFTGGYEETTTYLKKMP